MEIPLKPSELARAADISVPFASQIISGKRKASPEMARRIEEATGIPRHTLRPDIFDDPASDLARETAPASEAA